MPIVKSFSEAQELIASRWHEKNERPSKFAHNWDDLMQFIIEYPDHPKNDQAKGFSEAIEYYIDPICGIDSGWKVTANPDEAVSIAFQLAMPQVSMHEVKELYVPLNQVAGGGWSNCLYRGSQSDIELLLLENLNCTKLRDDFLCFSVKWWHPSADHRREGVVEINAEIGGFMTPLQIWHTNSEYFASGDSSFKLDASSNLSELKYESFETN